MDKLVFILYKIGRENLCLRASLNPYIISVIPNAVVILF